MAKTTANYLEGSSPVRPARLTACKYLRPETICPSTLRDSKQSTYSLMHIDTNAGLLESDSHAILGSLEVVNRAMSEMPKGFCYNLPN